MADHLDIHAEEVRNWAAQARYVMVAARCLEQGAPADPIERMNCMLYLMEVAEDLTTRAEHGADKLAYMLQNPVTS